LSSDNNPERERKVLELHSKGKTIREVVKERRISLRDIGLILTKHRVNHDNKKSSNKKGYSGYKLFSKGKEPLDVAIQLNLRQKEVWCLAGLF
jgi:hypothetical protein